ncbi:MAG: hypothetical protein HFF26_04330 [Oscillospiraceae bacterium]|nr:hypothetical protein [Oscillospiraceae bacterium]
MEQEREQKRENVAAGAVGAFLGSLVGVLCIVLIDQLGYVASISGLVMAVGALKGYELLGGRLSRMGAVISCVLILIMTYLAHQLTWAIAVAGVAEAGIFECFQAIPALLEAEALEGRIYWGNLALLYLFTLVGAVPTIISGLQGSDLPDLPRASAAAQGTEEVEAAFYPGNPKWLRPLRFSASLSMLLGLVPTVVLMFMAFGDNYAPSLILAGFGCLISSIVMMLIGLAHVQLAQNATFLMVRVNGMVWKVNLPLLNVSDTYRFTKKNGAIRAIRWDILSAEEQERARASILRAISLLSSGQVMPGSILSRAVMPLTDFQFIQEDSWRWLGSYANANGRRKKLSIPKAYPGFAPVPGMEPAQEPVPPRWGLFILSVVLAAVLALAGAGFGMLLEGPALNSPNPTPTQPVEATPSPDPTPTSLPDPQELFHVGEELGYAYTGVGYIKAPDGMFGYEGAYVDAHVPYSQDPVYPNDGRAIRSAAHGMEVEVTIAQSDGNAVDVVDSAYQAMVDAGMDIYEDGVTDTQYFEEYDVAVKQVSYFEEDRTKVRVVALYADYKQDGFYLSASITYQPELMDEDYPALLQELSDAYALTLPEIPPME